MLLAAGAGTRFGGDKLLALLPNGTAVGVAALDNLLAAGLSVTAVVRPHDRSLADLLAARGAAIVVCPEAARGMAHSLGCAIRSVADSADWLIALADMPHVKPATIATIAAALRSPTDLAVPFHRGRRGNPVAIGASYRQDLLALDGDVGARALFERYAQHVRSVDVDDPSVLSDIDTPDDLTKASA